MSIARDRKQLIEWYRSNRRDLPWRQNTDPYRIWISEVMLQQTTVAAVVPYYEKFMQKFPRLEDLATAPLESVLDYWAGLGYYSRARNLHKSAQELFELERAQKGFPQTFEQLLELPGFGPYTARAVASLAFNQPVGVLDGNVIRVLSRMYGRAVEWWKPAGRAELQALADQLADTEASADLNQGLMELGATVCTPLSPACLICPWVKDCVARREDQIGSLPLKRPRREREIWIWKPVVALSKGEVALVQNQYAPFLKNQWLYPGEVVRAAKPPKKFDYKHTVTHHDIYVVVTQQGGRVLPSSLRAAKPQWVPVREIRKWNPTSLVQKALDLSRA